MRLFSCVVAFSLFAVGCESEPMTPDPIPDRASIWLPRAEFASITQAVCEYVAKKRNDRWRYGNSQVTLSYDGTALTTIQCEMDAETGTHLYFWRAADICEPAPTVIQARVFLVKHGVRVPEGCEQGSRHVAEIRIPLLRQIKESECARPLPHWGKLTEAQNRCGLIDEELEYYVKLQEHGDPRSG